MINGLFKIFNIKYGIGSISNGDKTVMSKDIRRQKHQFFRAMEHMVSGTKCEVNIGGVQTIKLEVL